MTIRIAGLTLLLAGFAAAQEVEFQVVLLNRIGTETSRKGDMVSARVVAPAGFEGAVLEGKITECTSGARSRGPSVLDIEFDALRQAGTLTPIVSKVISAGNSKGQANVDDEGRVILRPGSNARPSPPPPALGRALGGIAGGRAARVGAAADSTVTSVARTSANAPNLRFDPGAKFIVRASTRSGAPVATPAPSPAAEGPKPATGIVPVYAPATAAPAAATTAAAAPTPTPAPGGAPAAAAGSVQPDLKAVKAEFVPGDRTIFFDDFTDMTGEDAPPHWKVRGGTAELRKGGDVRQLTITANRVVLTPNLKEFPKNFTMEAVTKYNGHGVGVIWNFKNKAARDVMFMRLEANYTKLIVQFRVGPESITSQQLPMDWTQPVRQSLWLQNGRLRLYINGERVFDANQIDVGDLASVEGMVLATQTPGQPERYFGFQSVRFAESVPDLSQVLTSTGRYVVRGILFDTDSDRLKPESAPSIKKIASSLEGNPNLKLLIEGHTDSVGDAAHNLDLSKRRAEAVKAVLVGQFNVDASRLSSAGLGATKPVDSNDTVQGRAQNRRVELVRQ